MKCFIELLKQQFQKNSCHPAVIYHHRSLTFGELEQKAETMAAFLREKGLEKGDIVILYTPEKLPFLILHLGIILCGGVSLPLNPDFTSEEMIYFLNDSGARFVFASGEQASIIQTIKDKCLHLEAVFDPALALETKENKKINEVSIMPGDYCFMLYSSGTTGQPKGVVHTHANTAASLLSLQKCWEFSSDDVLLDVLPLFHIHGLSFAAHLSLISGSSMIISDRFHPLKTMEKIKEATVFMGVPTFYYAFLKRQEFKEKANQWQRTRLFTCGSAPIRSEVLEEIETIIGKPLINRYGMTESHVIASLPLEGPYKHGSVGLPLEGIEIKIEKGEPREPRINTVKQGQKQDPRTGEVMVRSQNLFNHYWKKPGAHQLAFDEQGFFKTGDLGYLDGEGYLFLVGRVNDLIITSGFNVYPSVVERVINEFPGIKESAVIGIPDALKGERVMAVVVAESEEKPGIKQLKKHCRNKLANYQCPVHFEMIKELPRNTMGKILKRKLKEKYTA
ncbi:MAG: AMP-binding protein [Candidatus Aminicenantes bacterium]|nr:MAG: AMP-binding protein [Candidatus Aminicenantes bacterium]